MSSRAVTSKVSALLSKYTSPKAASTASSSALASPSARPATAATAEDEFDVDFDSQGEPIRRLRPRTAEPTVPAPSIRQKGNSNSIVARSLPEAQLRNAIAKSKSVARPRRDDLSEEVTDDLSVQIDYDDESARHDSNESHKPPLHPPTSTRAKKDEWESEFEEEMSAIQDDNDDDEKVTLPKTKSTTTRAKQSHQQRIAEEESLGDELTIDVSSDQGSPHPNNQNRRIASPQPHQVRPTTAASDETIEFEDESQQQQQQPPPKPTKPQLKTAQQRSASPQSEQVTEIEFDEELTPPQSSPQVKQQQQQTSQIRAKYKSKAQEPIEAEIEFDEQVTPLHKGQRVIATPTPGQFATPSHQQRGALQPLSLNKQQTVTVEEETSEIDDEVDGPINNKLQKPKARRSDTMTTNDEYSEDFISAGAPSVRQQVNQDKLKKSASGVLRSNAAGHAAQKRSDSPDADSSPHCCHCHHARGENRRSKQRESTHYQVEDIGIQTEPYLAIEAPPALFPSYRMPSQSIMAQQQQQYWLAMGVAPPFAAAASDSQHAATAAPTLPPWFPFASPELHSALHKQAMQPLDEAQLQQQQQQQSSEQAQFDAAASAPSAALPSLASAFAPAFEPLPKPPHMRQADAEQQASQTNADQASASASAVPSLSEEARLRLERLYPISSGLPHSDASHAFRKQLSEILSSLDVAKKQLDQSTGDYESWRAKQMPKRSAHSFAAAQPTMSYETAIASMRW